MITGDHAMVGTFVPVVARRPSTALVQQSGTKRARTAHRYTTQVLLTSLPLFIADLLALMGCIFLAVAVMVLFELESPPNCAPLLPWLSVAFLLTYVMFGLYPGTGHNPITELRQISLATTLLFTVFFAARCLLHKGQPLMLLFVITWLFSLMFLPLMRAAARLLFSDFRWWGQPVLIFGGGHAGLANFKYLVSNPRLGLRPVGVVDDTYWTRENDTWLDRSAYLGPPEIASTLANKHRIFWAIVTMSERSSAEVLQLIKTHASHFPHVLFVPDMDGLPSLWNRTYDYGGQLGIGLETSLLMPLPRLLKRIADLIIVTAGGLCCLPLMAVIALLIKCSSPGPIIFRQERIGFKGRRFQAHKFRTMVANADQVLERYLTTNPKMLAEWEKGHKLKNDPRVTSVGRWLRKLSLDELPQLWNVLCGEMSLVGPRPIVKEEIIKYGESYGLYAKVAPGLTGLWQISGRNNTSYATRVRLDSYYVRNWSPCLDFYILARTFRVVLNGEGAY
ncbi:MAG: undecaprenyl-phosphate galactose phosphotransferase WbaP [bacterium]